MITCNEISHESESTIKATTKPNYCYLYPFFSYVVCLLILIITGYDLYIKSSQKMNVCYLLIYQFKCQTEEWKKLKKYYLANRHKLFKNLNK